MTHPAEQIVADAIMSGDTETGLRQITCNAAASMRMTCDCGKILDQRTCFVLESIDDAGKEQTLTVLCKECAKRNAVKLATIAKHDEPQGIRYRWQTWAKTIPIEPIGKPIGKPAKAPTVRAISILQLIRGKEQSIRIRPYALAIHVRWGLVSHRGEMIIDTGKANPEAIIPEDIKERAHQHYHQSAGFLKRQTTDELVCGEIIPGTGDNAGRTYRRMVRKAYPHSSACVVDEKFRRSAEKHGKGNFRRWLFSPDRHVNAIVGVNSAGEETAIVVCVDVE